MAASIASLVAQPQAPQAPQGQGSASGGDKVNSLSDLVGNDNDIAGGAKGGAAIAGGPAPDYSHTEATLRHLSIFQRKWQELLKTPGIGKTNIRPQIMEMMADVMGEGLVSLPQVMSQLKSLPPDPLQQKQWIEKHFEQGQLAISSVLAHHALAFPRTGNPSTDPPVPPPNDNDNHQQMMGEVVEHYSGKRK